MGSTVAMDGKASRPRKRVLVLDEEIPFPVNTGKRIRTLNLLANLSEEFEIDLLVHSNGATSRGIAEIEKRGIRVLVAESSVPDKSGLGFPLRVAMNLFSSLPYSVDSHYRAGYRTRLGELVAERPYDLAHVEWSPYAHYLRGVSMPWIVSAHNVESQIWTRMAEQESFAPKRAFIAMQARRMLRFEKQTFARARWSTAVSEEDATTLRGFGCRRIEVVPNGVDIDFFQDPGGQDRTPEEPHTLVFTGSMDWRPNQDAVVFFLEEILPRLEQHGNFKLLVVGRNPPAWLEESCRDKPQIELTGTVDDVRPFMARGAVFVVPLRIGGGSRLKILEAFSMRRAVVSTRVGAEGLNVRDGEHLLLADQADDFVQAILALRANAERRRLLGEAGRKLVHDSYSWPQIARLQAALWHEASS